MSTSPNVSLFATILQQKVRPLSHWVGGNNEHYLTDEEIERNARAIHGGVATRDYVEGWRIAPQLELKFEDLYSITSAISALSYRIKVVLKNSPILTPISFTYHGYLLEARRIQKSVGVSGGNRRHLVEVRILKEPE